MLEDDLGRARDVGRWGGGGRRVRERAKERERKRKKGRRGRGEINGPQSQK